MDLQLGEIIKSVRSDLGWTMQQMGDFLEMSKGSVSKFESGKLRIKNEIPILKKINTLGYEFKVSAKSGETIVSVPLFESNLTVTKK